MKMNKKIQSGFDTYLQSMDKKPKIGISVLIFNKNQVLFGKRLKKNGYKKWATPGGHLEMFETFEECAIRETKEEANIDIENVKLLDVKNCIYKECNEHYVAVILLASIKKNSQELLNKEKDKCEEWKWFNMDNIPDNLFELNDIFSSQEHLEKINNYLMQNNLH